MAEILISLTIIGVVAAICLPAVIGNINERAWNAQKKALYTRMSQAIALMPALTGYGEYDGVWHEGGSVTVNKDTAAHHFVADGLAKVFNITNICAMPANTTTEDAQSEFAKCGIVSEYTTYGNQKKSMPTRLYELNSMFNFFNTSYSNPLKNVNTQAAAFETVNGESILAFYNPRCTYARTRAEAAKDINAFAENFFSQYGHYPNSVPNYALYFQQNMCVNFLYDLNGNKGPNKIYKDMGFMTVFYPTDSEVVAPIILKKNAKNPENPSEYAMPYNLTQRACTTFDKHSRVPTVEEMMAIVANYKMAFAGETSLSGYIYWTNTAVSPLYAYMLTGTGNLMPGLLANANDSVNGNPRTVRCVKK